MIKASMSLQVAPGITYGPQALSTANVADGLSAINELIFKQKKITGAEMLDALKKNWKVMKRYTHWSTAAKFRIIAVLKRLIC